jgi:hypothetical protein
MMIPSVHLNGTSKEELIRQLIDASEALLTATAVLSAAAPNPRDYYPQGPDAALLAAGEHATRVMTLYRMRDELQAIAEKIDT